MILHGAEVVHHIPGRLRVRLPKSRRDPAVLRHLHDFITGLGGVRSVEINPATGSVLVHYDPESHQQIKDMVQAGGESDDAWQIPPGFGDADGLANQIEKEADFLAAHSEMALHIVNSAKALDRTIRKATDNTVDLKVLLPASLAVWAFFTAGAEFSTPLWVSLGIFSFNSFVALHRPMTVHVSTHKTDIDSEKAS